MDIWAPPTRATLHPILHIFAGYHKIRSLVIFVCLLTVDFLRKNNLTRRTFKQEPPLMLMRDQHIVYDCFFFFLDAMGRCEITKSSYGKSLSGLTHATCQFNNVAFISGQISIPFSTPIPPASPPPQFSPQMDEWLLAWPMVACPNHVVCHAIMLSDIVHTRLW